MLTVQTKEDQVFLFQPRTSSLTQWWWSFVESDLLLLEQLHDQLLLLLECNPNHLIQKKGWNFLFGCRSEECFTWIPNFLCCQCLMLSTNTNNNS